MKLWNAKADIKEMESPVDVIIKQIHKQITQQQVEATSIKYRWTCRFRNITSWKQFKWFSQYYGECGKLSNVHPDPKAFKQKMY